MRFKKNLKYLLKENNMTAKELAGIIGMDARKIFSDKVHLDKLEQISVLFMVNSYDLMFGSVKKSPKILKEMPDEIKKDKQSMDSVMQFFKIISNYRKINNIFIDGLDFEPNPFNI